MWCTNENNLTRPSGFPGAILWGWGGYCSELGIRSVHHCSQPSSLPTVDGLHSTFILPFLVLMEFLAVCTIVCWIRDGKGGKAIRDLPSGNECPGLDYYTNESEIVTSQQGL